MSMAKPTNKSNFTSRYNLPQPDHEETLEELVAQGFKLLAADEAAKHPPVKEKKRLETKLEETSPNPYIRARCQILAAMSTERRKVIEKMESGQLLKDYVYEDFVKEVMKQGDILSNS